MTDESTGSNGSPPPSPPSLTPWKPSGPVDVRPEDSPAFIRETCQRMAMILPHFLIPLYTQRNSLPDEDEGTIEMHHMIATLEMATVAVAMLERSQEARPRPSLTVMKGGLLDASGNPLAPA